MATTWVFDLTACSVDREQAIIAVQEVIDDVPVEGNVYAIKINRNHGGSIATAWVEAKRKLKEAIVSDRESEAKSNALKDALPDSLLSEFETYVNS